MCSEMSWMPDKFLGFLRAFAPFGFMGAMTYSFANPDEDNVYDIFPVQKSKYAFICGYVVPDTQRLNFEHKWKDMARYYQKQDGYLYNKLVRQETADKSGNIVYLDFNQCTTGEAYKVAAIRSLRQTLWDSIQSVCVDSPDNFKYPLMYKSVVDDTQFAPSEIIHARALSNAPRSMNLAYIWSSSQNFFRNFFLDEVEVLLSYIFALTVSFGT